jgi:hypothetical protein
MGKNCRAEVKMGNKEEDQKEDPRKIMVNSDEELIQALEEINKTLLVKEKNEPPTVKEVMKVIPKEQSMGGMKSRQEEEKRSPHRNSNTPRHRRGKKRVG